MLKEGPTLVVVSSAAGLGGSSESAVSELWSLLDVISGSASVKDVSSEPRTLRVSGAIHAHPTPAGCDSFSASFFRRRRAGSFGSFGSFTSFSFASFASLDSLDSRGLARRLRLASEARSAAETPTPWSGQSGACAP